MALSPLARRHNHWGPPEELIGEEVNGTTDCHPGIVPCLQHKHTHRLTAHVAGTGPGTSMMSGR